MSSWFGSSCSPEAEAEDRGDHPAYRRRADEGALFTASKCPHEPGLENSCELPFGIVWTPLAVPEDYSTKMPIINCFNDSLPPVLCLACLAYINPSAKIDKKSGIWACPLCGHENVLPKKGTPEHSRVMTALKSNYVEYRQAVSKPEGSEEEKMEDDEEKEDYCTYLLVVDENLSPKDAHAIAPAMEAILKEQSASANPEDPYSKARIGLVTFGKSVSIYQLGVSGLASADIYVPTDYDEDDDKFDENVEKRSYITDVHLGDCASLKNSLQSIFGIAIDENDDESASSSTGIFSSNSSRMAMLSQRKAARLRKEENATDHKNDVSAKSPWIKRYEKSPSHQTKRCTGQALQCTLDLASAVTSKSSRTSRIILFTNGCPNSGDGSVVNSKDNVEKPKGKRATHTIVDTEMLQKSVDYFDLMANQAVAVGIGVDVVCCGVTELALPVYQAMVEASGGYVFPLVTLDTPQFKENLKFILDNTYISRSMYIPEDMNEMNGAECILDIRSDSFVTPTQLCGPGQLLPDSSGELVETETSAFEEGSSLALEKGFKIDGLPSSKAMALSMTRIEVGRIDPLSTITVLLEVDDTISEDDEYAFFQFISRYISRGGDTEITRVFSAKLLIAKDVNDFLGSVDDEVTSVVLAKIAVHRSLHGREETGDTRDLTAAGDSNTQEKLSYEAQLDLDATIQRISGAFRLLDLEKNTQRRNSKKLTSDGEISQSSLDFAFPPQLKETLNRLYHLRRGRLISPGPMQSMDDRAESRRLFIRFPLEDCLQMIRPSIWSTGSMNISSGWDSMLPFPAETLALWDDSIIAADFHDSLFIWSGSQCSAKRYDLIRSKFREKLLDSSKHRFPKPVLHELNAGDSMSRKFTARLAPSHADPIDNQIVHFPLLSTLKPEALNDLRSKFKFYDSKSDESFRTWFWSVASASNHSRMEGMSLCE